MVGGGLARVAVVVGVQVAVVEEGVKVVVAVGVDGILGAKGEIMEVAIRHGGLVTPPNISRGRETSRAGRETFRVGRETSRVGREQSRFLVG